ncbi:hypothetical protein [Verrucomicrobium sp. BvORR034]|jgi:hypothetical protein|uniref:hypothetical protein n=1 Tax=Verrucomicrobium sp. BvORR034 TaxID=1396418 RepID=UPI000679BAB5|nr:hypothetical protein [Verrucomicrobium sp. BvORR034]
MNWNLALLPALALSTLVLASCESTGPAGGTVITNPNAEEVTHMESQWGMKPRIVKPRLRPMEPGDLPENTVPTPNPTYNAAPESAPLAPAPAPQLQEPVTSEAPTVDQATIQKLR